MFGKKKNIPSIDSEQLELIQNAQQRIKQNLPDPALSPSA